MFTATKATEITYGLSTDHKIIYTDNSGAGASSKKPEDVTIDGIRKGIVSTFSLAGNERVVTLKSPKDVSEIGYKSQDDILVECFDQDIVIGPNSC